MRTKNKSRESESAFLTWRSARRRHDARVLHLGEPEVADHDLRVRVLVLVQQVLRLQVAVHHALAVHVRDGVQDLEILKATDGLTHSTKHGKNRFEFKIYLPYEVGRVLLRVGALLHDPVEELAAGHPIKVYKKRNGVS